ncbi:2OG-Fe(II) oxygenase [Ferrimicrobium sp.]|uniref:2OG-Fe(II) oxygenase n=1 Tax=Ferrimicrobium sp. TaxID=2926050 RepID=UPI00263A346B|nr:2OG-Fe(II) oxygenase [Ferrimicrobium sp.]
MSSTARERLAALLANGVQKSNFSAGRTAPTDDLHLEVQGVGTIQLPVPQAQARLLCAISRPARYGQGERTLLDRRVRDTWEVPKSRVKIDKRRWHQTLGPVLDHFKSALGFPEGSQLRAEFHSMLVYGPGQFFLPHQDSEKDDAMVGSLVVGLPSAFTGGALEVHQGTETATYRGSKKALSFVGFFSDCQHEVKPVTSGYRVVLTYDLIAVSETRQPSGEVNSELIDKLVGCLDEHFGTPSAPEHLVYLLDHQYTPRALSWSRLKGIDGRSATLLEAAAERADYEVVLALADVHETWSTDESEPPSHWYRHSDYGDDDDEYDDEDHDVQELIESEITLHTWIDPSGASESDLSLSVGDDEVCASTPSDSLEPYSSEYEGYMGNWGNTLDRWYHRGAIVLWPRQRAFIVRAQASPGWALDTLIAQIHTGDLEGAQNMAATLAPFWDREVSRAQSPDLIAGALSVARLIAEPELAAALLRPFRLEMLSHTHAKTLSALSESYGEAWMSALVAQWSLPQRYYYASTKKNTETWIAELPQLCGALAQTGGSGGEVARLLLVAAKNWTRESIESALMGSSPSRRRQHLSDLGVPVAGVLQGAGLVRADAVSDELIGLVCSGGDRLLDCAIAVLRTTPPTEWEATGLELVKAHVRYTLTDLLARSQRRDDDWSILLPPGCTCELCSKLATFLADPATTQLEWPLRQDGRAHMHHRIDASELPVTHQTRRTGRPYTLVLTKTGALFEREREERQRFETELAWLDGSSWVNDAE